MSERRPVIGICAALEQAQYSGWDVQCVMLQHAYIQSVQRAGAMVIMIPPDPVLCEDPDEILDHVDALLLAGGPDIDPALYGQAAHPETHGVVAARDAVELALIKRAIERDQPTLGICRGMQMLNIVRGGTLLQHLPDVLHNDEHRRNPGTFDGNEHDVRLDAGSLAEAAAGTSVTMTKSHHHQGIDRLGDGLTISGHSTLDELPEAIELPESTYVLGVQWHPEADTASRVVRSLVTAARAQRTAVTSA